MKTKILTILTVFLLVLTIAFCLPVFSSAESETINSITYNFTVTNGAITTVAFSAQSSSYKDFNASVDVEGNGDYSVTIDNINADALNNLGSLDATSALLTVTTILVNDTYLFEVNAALQSGSTTYNSIGNIWAASGKADVLYTGESLDGLSTATITGGKSIKLEVEESSQTETDATTTNEEDSTEATQETTAEPTTEASSEATTENADISIIANLVFSDADNTPSCVYDPVSVEITGNGVYTLSYDGTNASNGKRYSIDGVTVFCVDLVDAYENYPDIDVKLVSITVDGVEVSFDADKILYGDFEKNGNLRIEIYSEYGASKGDSAIRLLDIYAEEALTVSFSVTGLSEDATEASLTDEPATEVTTDEQTGESDEPTTDDTEEPVTESNDKLLGDVNFDGKITTADVGLANSHAKGIKLLSDEQFEVADMNDDGKVTTADVGIINAYAKGIKK
ncbi:MAG: dockerin type I repeat-containing protein [Ruminococcus sp.]|nr:dockerin type I repeat-containing protein [Ruminococcus sp.]